MEIGATGIVPYFKKLHGETTTNLYVSYRCREPYKENRIALSMVMGMHKKSSAKVSVLSYLDLICTIFDSQFAKL